MNKFLQVFFIFAATVLFTSGCITVNVGGGLSGQADVQKYGQPQSQVQQRNYLLVPGQPDVTKFHIWRKGGDWRIPREEGGTIVHYTPAVIEVEENSSYFNTKAENYHGNTGGRGPTNRYRY